MFEFDWLSSNRVVDEIVPQADREQFEKTYVEPLRRRRRGEQIAEQLAIPPQIERIEKQLAELAPKEEAAKSKRIAIERTLAAIQSDLAAAKADEDSLHWQAFELRGNIERLKARQAAHGSPLLPEFYSEMLKEWEKLRNSGSHEVREGKPHFVTGKTTKTFWTNRPAVERAVTYVRAAMLEAEEMKSLPLHDDEIKARLDALRKGIPDHRELTEIETSSAVFIEKERERYGEFEPPPYF